MNLPGWLRQWRDWFPVPVPGRGVRPLRWLLLDGNRNAATAVLLSLVFVALLGVGTVWTFELRRLLTETSAVETILTTLLSGIILLVSIVVSINSIVLSHDITSVQTQENRIEGVVAFRRELGHLTDEGESPSDPASFLSLMGEVLGLRAHALVEVAEGAGQPFARAIEEYADAVSRTADHLEEPTTGAEFGVLWRGLEVDYGHHLDRSRNLRSRYDEQFTSDLEDRLDDLVEALQLFATGKEYFKTLYYTRETSQLSRTLLAVALPAIIINASTVLAIHANLLPAFWFLGLPPLLVFVATTFTVSLAPFVVLTAYMLRLATVARRTAGAGPFQLTR